MVTRTLQNKFRRYLFFHDVLLESLTDITKRMPGRTQIKKANSQKLQTPYTDAFMMTVNAKNSTDTELVPSGKI